MIHFISVEDTLSSVSGVVVLRILSGEDLLTRGQWPAPQRGGEHVHLARLQPFDQRARVAGYDAGICKHCYIYYHKNL